MALGHRLGFLSLTPGVPDRAPTKLRGDDIEGWMNHPEFPYTFVAVVNGQMNKFLFWCDACGKWLKLSGSLGNLRKHVKVVHTSALNPERRVPLPIDRKDLFFLAILDANLAFRLVENVHIRQLTGVIMSAKEVSKRARVYMRLAMVEMKDTFMMTEPRQVVVTFDEWT
jgi:hypothetical protein